MFVKGLIHKVNIYPIEKNTSNRTQLAEMRNSSVPLENIRCRIVKDEKIMLEPHVSLKEGDVIENPEDDTKYTVESENYKAVGFNIHHRSYKIKKKVI